jgi:hypothetical protein
VQVSARRPDFRPDAWWTAAVDVERTRALRELLGDTDWVTRSRVLARGLRRATPGGLLLVGTRQYEPWHVTAHLADEARAAGLPGLAPTLVRHAVPPGAPAHLSVDLSRIEQADRRDTLFVVAPLSVDEGLLTRLVDARRGGATLLSLDRGDPELGSLAHERFEVAPSEVLPEADLAFATAQHLVSVAAGEFPVRPAGGVRDRLARLLDAISG